MIRIENVSKQFRGVDVLRDVSLEVPDSRVVVILGPSGIGKTVLLKIITGLMAPDRGAVHYDDAALGWGMFADNRQILAQVGYVFQGGALFDSMDVAENIALPLTENRHLSRGEVEERLREVLKRVGMADASRLRPGELSGGMVRLVAIARAIVTDPRYVFYDEPTTGLDPVMRERVCRLIASLRDQEGKTEVVVTHDLEAVEAVADSIYMLRDGRLSALDSVRKEDYETHGS